LKVALAEAAHQGVGAPVDRNGPLGALSRMELLEKESPRVWLSLRLFVACVEEVFAWCNVGNKILR
jgi:hypothetical protein